MSTPIRAALFDMDGVLRHWTGRGRTTAEHSARLPAGTLRRLAYGEAFTLANLGILTHHQWLESVRATLVAEFGPLAAGAVDVWAADAGTLAPEAVALVGALRGRGVRVGVLSNNTTGLRSDLERLGFEEFDVLVNSAEEGVVKPSPLLYRIAAERMGHAPEELFFTDDKALNVTAARYVGMRAERYTTPISLSAQLSTIGLLTTRSGDAPAA